MDEAGEQVGLSSYMLLHSATATLNTRAVIEQLGREGAEPPPFTPPLTGRAISVSACPKRRPILIDLGG
jgi:hypothetical protein